MRRSSLTSFHVAPASSDMKTPAVLRLDDRVDTGRVGARDRDADLAPDRLGQPGVLRQLGPVAPPSVVLKRPLPGPPLESECGVRNTSHRAAYSTSGFFGSIDEIDGAGLLVAEERRAPTSCRRRSTGTRRVRDSARTDLPALRRRRCRVGWVDSDARDGVGLFESRVRPRLAAVDRLVDAVALDDVAAQLRLAHPDVHDVGIRLGDGDRTNRRGLEEAIGDRAPGHAAVGGLPEAAAGRAEVILERPARAARCRLRSSAAAGPIDRQRSPVKRAGSMTVATAGVALWAGACAIRERCSAPETSTASTRPTDNEGNPGPRVLGIDISPDDPGSC